MKNWRQYHEKCMGNRPEVSYKSQFVFCPEPHIAIALSELMYDTDMSARAMLDMLLEYALEHVELVTKVVKPVKYITFTQKQEEKSDGE